LNNPILIGDFVWCGTNTTGIFLHLSDDVFVYGQGYAALNKDVDYLKRAGKGQPPFSSNKIFRETIEAKNSVGILPHHRIAIREQSLLVTFYNSLKGKNLNAYYNKAKLIFCMRRPYELFFARLFRLRNSQHDRSVEIDKFFANTKDVLDKCYSLKEKGFDILFVDVTTGGTLGLRKILRFLDMEPTKKQEGWMSLNPAMNQATNRGEYVDLREEHRAWGTSALHELYKHPAVKEAYK